MNRQKKHERSKNGNSIYMDLALIQSNNNKKKKQSYFIVPI